jgi:methyltransferase (TIGR00027 family)
MEEGRPSATATMMAVMRAAHLVLDDDPKIFRDHLALDLSGVENEAALLATVGEMEAVIARRSTPEFARAVARYVRANAAMRQRYTEDKLEKAVKRGVVQYVILGAGLDSFAYRRRDLAAVLEIFEVDHPATQRWKRTRLQELNVTFPGNLTFVSVDFERQTLADALRAGCHRPELPTFVSWLGVSMYLTEAAVFETLRYVASLAPGSEIVFQYSLPESLLDEESRRLVASIKTTAALGGEPWLSQFEPATLKARLKKLGFTQVWDLGPEEADARFFRAHGWIAYCTPLAPLESANWIGRIQSCRPPMRESDPYRSSENLNLTHEILR